MGLDPAPLMINLFLFHYEKEFMNSLNPIPVFFWEGGGKFTTPVNYFQINENNKMKVVGLITRVESGHLSIICRYV